MFQHMYWVTLAVVYITVQSTISIFNFGFILWCFVFLWHGQALYLQRRTRLFRLWKIFIGYNYFTLLAKVCLQVRERTSNEWTSLRSWRDFARECFCFDSEVVNSNFTARGLRRSSAHESRQLHRLQMEKTSSQDYVHLLTSMRLF